MFCGYCGNTLKEGARFCSECGAPVKAISNDDEATNAVHTDAAGGANRIQESQLGFAGQMEADRKRSRKKLSPLMIIAIVLALLAGTALAAVLVVSQANQGERPASQGASTEASQPAESAQAEQGSTSAESASAEQAATVDPEQVRAEAREVAIAEGKQVYTGTIMSTTDEDAWVMSTGRNPNAGPYYNNRSVTILFLDQKTAIEGFDPLPNRSYKTLQDQDVIELPDSFASYDGQRVDMAFLKDDLSMPSDVSHIKGDGEIIYVEGSAGSGAA